MANDVKTLILPTSGKPLGIVLQSLLTEVVGSIPDFVEADGEDLAIILADPSTSSERAYDCRFIPPGTTAILGVGDADQPPESGGVIVRYDGDPLASAKYLDYPTLTASLLQSALNDLPARAQHKVAVVQKGINFTITDLDSGVRPDLLADGELLVPLSGASVKVFREGTADDPVNGTFGDKQVAVLTIAQANLALSTVFTALPPANFQLTPVQMGEADVPANGNNPAVVGLPARQRLTLDPPPYGGAFAVDGQVIPWNATAAVFAENYFGDKLSYAYVSQLGPTTWEFTQKTNGPKQSTVAVNSLLVPAGLQTTLNLSTEEFFYAFTRSGVGDVLSTKISFKVNFPGKLPKTFLLGDVDVYRSILDTDNLVSAAAQAVTAFGASLLQLADPAAGRLALGLRAAATADIGEEAGTVAAGDDSRIVNAYENYAQMAAVAVDSLLVGKTPSAATQNFFSVYDGVNKIFTRNPACITPWPSWASCWNSANADGTGGNRGCVVMVTPTQGITNNHFAQPRAAGTVHYFLGTDGQNYPLTVASASPGEEGATDIYIVTFTTAAPAAVGVATFLPAGTAAQILPAGTPVVFSAQDHVARIGEFVSDNAGTVTIRSATAANRTAWTRNPPALPGDSDQWVAAYVNGGLVVLTTWHLANSNPSYGPSISDAISAINALLVAGTSLTVAAVNPLPIAGAGASLTGNNDFTGSNTFAGAVGNPDGTWQVNPDGSASFADGGVAFDTGGNAVLAAVNGVALTRGGAGTAPYAATVAKSGTVAMLSDIPAGGGVSTLPTYPPVGPLVSDSFAATDGTALTAHAGESGATWTLPTGGASAVIYGNQAVLKGGTMRSTYVPASADYVVTASVYKATNPPGQVAICARMSADGQTFYWATLNSANQIGLYKFVGGANSAVSGAVSRDFNVGETHVLTLSVIGSSIVVSWDNAVVISATDASITAPGTVGLFGGDATSDATHDIHLDNLSVTFPKTQVVVGFGGDSITADGRAEAAFKSYVESQLYYTTLTFINEGVAGSASGDWLSGSANLTAAEAAWNAAGVGSVVFTIGTNDAKAGVDVPVATYQSNVSAIVAHILANVPTCQYVVLNEPTYPTPGAGSGSWDATSPPLAQQYGLALSRISNGTTIRRGSVTVFDCTRLHPELSADGIHPNAAGYGYLGINWAQAWLNQPAAISTH